MDSKRMNICYEDLISNLPEALICHILSFLSTKDAVLTSVLSRRWRYLLAFVPNLDFDDKVLYCYELGYLKREEMRTSFQVFVDRIMALQGNASVNKFSLSCEVGAGPSSVNGWIFNVLVRGVVDLELKVPMGYGYRLPSEVLMSKTLVKLKLTGTDEITIDVGQVSLPKLKSLYLIGVAFNESAAFAKLVSGCHVLEELVMIEVKFYSLDFFLVSNPTLKRLQVCFHYFDGKPKTVSFDTPNLVYLDFTDTVAVKYPKVNYYSLVEADLDLRMRHYQDEPAGDSGNATNLFMGICNVEILYLYATTLEVLAFCCKAAPVFSNLIHLTIDTDKEVQWELLPKLLENCPNLETLVFRGLHYKDTTNHCKPWEDTRTCLSSNPVKMLKVLKFGEIYSSEEQDEMDKQKEVIKYFLETMPNLEQVMIYYDTSIDDDPNILSTELQMLGKVASPKCKIQVLPDNISFS